MKTTVTGILIILGAIINCVLSYLKGAPIDFAVAATSIAAGYGLIKAADSKDVKAAQVASQVTSAENRQAINANSSVTGVPELPSIPNPSKTIP